MNAQMTVQLIARPILGLATIRDKLGHSSSDPLTPSLTASSASVWQCNQPMNTLGRTVNPRRTIQSIFHI